MPDKNASTANGWPGEMIAQSLELQAASPAAPILQCFENSGVLKFGVWSNGLIVSSPAWCGKSVFDYSGSSIITLDAYYPLWDTNMLGFATYQGYPFGTVPIIATFDGNTPTRCTFTGTIGASFHWKIIAIGA